jgi:hypothetical protein
MSETWLGCPNCVFAFSGEEEYGHYFELDHPGRKYRKALLVKSEGSQF